MISSEEIEKIKNADGYVIVLKEGDIFAVCSENLWQSDLSHAALLIANSVMSDLRGSKK